ncbi:unnamed protein product, partial [Heterosigma akashiwo]
MGKFKTIKANCKVTSGKCYYEAKLETTGCIQIGWTSDLFSSSSDNMGVGDDAKSYGMDLYRKKRWWKGWYREDGGKPYGSETWAVGDVIGVCVDFDSGSMHYTHNGESLGPAFTE